MDTIDKSCQNCKMNFNGICASHSGINGYGWNIVNKTISRICWDSSVEYLITLAHSLPEEDRKFFEYRNVSKEDLYFRIEHGQWPKTTKRL